MVLRQYSIYNDKTDELMGIINYNDNKRYTMECYRKGGYRPWIFYAKPELYTDPDWVHMVAEDFLNRRVVPFNREGLMPLLKKMYGIDYYDRDFLMRKNKGRVVTDAFRVEIIDKYA